MMAYGIGTTVGGMLPFSRKHESEADKIGLELMTIAGYNPEEAPKLWARMKAQSKGKQPEFLSTHPSEDRRIENLKEWIPQAKALAGEIKIITNIN
jgi:predicted Zn-dependent protease